MTDTSENGANDTHTVDNGGGRDNYVLFEFNQNVVVDSAYLGYVVGDSDLRVWVGTLSNPYANHVTLSDSVLSSRDFSEFNSGAGSTRTADFNSGQLAGNILVIATGTATDADNLNDKFKIQNLILKATASGIYENKATVTVNGLISADNDGSNASTLAAGLVPEVTLMVEPTSNTANNDDIRFDVASDPSKISVKLGTVGGAVNEIGQVSKWSGSGITINRILAKGFDGNDKIQVADALAINALLFGGNCNDTLGGGGGRDLLIGNAGSDTITGNSGDDILIGGASPYDANTAANTLALDAIMNEWASNKSFSQRVYNLSNKTVAPSGYAASQFSNRLNGSKFLQVSDTGKNLAADTALDSLIGNGGYDWVIGNSGGSGTLDTTGNSTNEKLSDL